MCYYCTWYVTQGAVDEGSRALITFAFIADKFEATRDIGDGLTHVSPIADQLAGECSIQLCCRALL